MSPRHPSILFFFSSCISPICDGELLPHLQREKGRCSFWKKIMKYMQYCPQPCAFSLFRLTDGAATVTADCTPYFHLFNLRYVSASLRHYNCATPFLASSFCLQRGTWEPPTFRIISCVRQLRRRRRQAFIGAVSTTSFATIARCQTRLSTAFYIICLPFRRTVPPSRRPDE